MMRAGRTIAIVDDESSVRVALSRLLRLAGYTVHGYATGEEMLVQRVHRAPDCAVLDVHLPGLSGFELEQRLREGHPRVAVVFITASDEVDPNPPALAGAGARLLRKPFSSNALLEAVSAALHARR